LKQPPDSPHGVLILQKERIVYANQRVADRLDILLEEIVSHSLQDFLVRIHPDDRSQLKEVLKISEIGTLVDQGLKLRLVQKDETFQSFKFLLNTALYHGESAVQLTILEESFLEVEQALRNRIERLEALHQLDRASLNDQREESLAELTVNRISHLIPHYLGSVVGLFDPDTNQFRILAPDFKKQDNDVLNRMEYFQDVLRKDFTNLKEEKFILVEDFSKLEVSEPYQKYMLKAGIGSYLSLPIHNREELLGVLAVASDQPGDHLRRDMEFLQEIASTLATASQMSRLRKMEKQRLQEAEVLRDIMASLAGAGNIKQALEVILVNLHNVIHYDRAGLFLAEEDERFVKVDRRLPGMEEATTTHFEEDPLVSEMRKTRKPLLVPDAQADERFENWPDIQPVRGWLGAPLMVGEEMLGFLSLGSLQVNAYIPSDADMIQAFAAQVANVLEKSWMDEQTQRRTEELEVLSSITFALGQAEGSEKTMFTIIEQLARFFNATKGAFLLPDEAGSSLTVKVSLDVSIIGEIHTLDLGKSYDEDLLWSVFTSGQTSEIPEAHLHGESSSGEIYQQLWVGCQSAVLIPLKTGETTFGILSFGFESHRRLSPANLRLFDAVAEIAGASLRRAVVLESLEKQVNIRTQHLSTLYNINTVASEPLELQIILDQLLEITLQSMNSSIGSVHFLDEKGRELYLVARKNIPQEFLPSWENLSLKADFWQELIYSSNPLVIPDVRTRMDTPIPIREMGFKGTQTYIGAPIRAKGQVLGLLSMFGATIQDYTIEDITLFMTIADQIGSSVERARLMKQAELAAVVQERQRLARELHDSVTQLLYGQVLFSGAGLKVLKQGNPQLTEQHLTRIDQAAQQALKEMRLLLYELRPSDTLDDGLVEALERRLDAVERRTGINAQVIVEGILDLDESTEMGLFRIAEEALNNTLKHAHATEVILTIEVINRKVFLEIKDNGQGFKLSDRVKSGGMGLMNMYERAGALDGDLEILTEPGQGTKIAVTIEELR